MAEEVALSAVTKAIEVAQGLIKEAQDQQRKEIDRCVSYLKAALELVHALYIEYEKILADARICNLKDKRQVEELLARNSHFITVHEYRPLLQNVIEELHQMRDLLQKRVGRRWQIWKEPWKSKGRKRALAELVDVVKDLEQFHAGIGEIDRTGIDRGTLHQIEKVLLDTRPDGPPLTPVQPNALRNLIREEDIGRAKDERADLTDSISRVIVHLPAQF